MQERRFDKGHVIHVGHDENCRCFKGNRDKGLEDRLDKIMERLESVESELDYTNARINGSVEVDGYWRNEEY